MSVTRPLAVAALAIATAWMPQAAAAAVHGPAAGGPCSPGYAKAHRHVSRALRDAIYTRFGIPRGSRRAWTLDHRVPVELGGSNEPSNLFPQPKAEAKRKDRDENRLCAEVRAGAISVSQARAEILRLWTR